MYENTNKTAVVEIARGNMGSHKLRNAMAILAIMLTTLLITVVCTVGISFYETMERGSDITPGPMADGAISANISAYDKIKGLDEVEWAGCVRPCNIGSLRNREMIGLNSKLFAADESYLKNNQIEIKEGRFPETSTELAISDTLAARLGLKAAVGESLPLRMLVKKNNDQEEIQVPMVITGVYTSPMEPLHNVYEEMYTHESFLTDVAPEMAQENASIYVKLTAGDGQVYDRLWAISEEVGGAGATYKTNNMSSLSTVAMAGGFLLLIIFCGYLIIYNIFYISVVNDIRFLGMMKTIGTTGRQVKRILSWQVRRLAVAGISLGVFCGYLVSLIAAPAVIAQTNYADFYENPKNPWGFIAAVLFAALTVWVSCRKSYRMASKISPVEAARYMGSGKSRRKLWSILSFAIGGMIFLIVYTAAIGYDVEKMVDRYELADVTITQEALATGLDEKYNPISKEMVKELKNLSFVENLSLFYLAKGDEDIDKDQNDARVPMALEGKWKTEWEDYLVYLQATLKRMGMDITAGEAREISEKDGNAMVRVMGMPAKELPRESRELRLVEGELDEAKFASGGYILYNQMGEQGKSLDKEHIHAGDVLPVTLYDPQKNEFVTVEKEVMAVYVSANGYAASTIRNAQIVFADTAFMEIFPEYDQWISHILVDKPGEFTKEEYEQVNNIIQSSFNSQISQSSRYVTAIEQQKTKASMTIIGLFLAGIFGLIGIANVVNTLVTSVMTRKLEYAAMQSVGMTRRQMCKSLISDGLKLAGVSTVLAILGGAGLGIPLLGNIGMFTGFSTADFAVAAGILMVVLVVMTFSVAVVLTRFLNRKPVVERLREAE